MRKQLLIIFFFGYSTGLEAQSWVYHPFPTDSAIWTNAHATYYSPTGMPPFTLVYGASTRYCMTSADTIIGSNNYSKIDYCGGVYRGGLRDDGFGKIYFIPSDSTNELLIYDFSIVAGDTVSVFETTSNWTNFTEHTYFINNTDSVLINSSYRKRIHVDGAYWIEGIGCTNGLFTESWINVSGWYIVLECMSVSDTTIYPTTLLGPCSLTSGIYEISEFGDFVLYPNPTTGLLQIKTEQEINSIEVLDIFGRKIYYSEKNQTEIDISNFTNGIYFVRLSDSKGNYVVKKIVKQ